MTIPQKDIANGIVIDTASGKAIFVYPGLFFVLFFQLSTFIHVGLGVGDLGTWIRFLGAGISVDWVWGL